MNHQDRRTPHAARQIAIINGARYLVVHSGPNRHQRRAAKHQRPHTPPFAKAMRDLALAGQAALAVSSTE